MESPKEFLEAIGTEDDIGLVIRAHVLMEQQLNKMFEVYFLRPNYIDKMNLDYHQKVSLAISTGLSQIVEKPLNCIGSIRNKFAHKSNQRLDIGTVNNFYNTFDEETKRNFHNSWKEVNNETNFNDLDPKERFRLMSLILHKYLRHCFFDLKRKRGLA